MLFKALKQNLIEMTNSLISFILSASSAESEGGLFDFNATLPVMAIQILLLTLVLNIIFYRPIGKVLDERDDIIRNQLTEASEMLMKAENITKQYELDLSQERREAQSIIASAQKGAQEIVAMEIKQAQKDTEQLVSEATNQLNSQKEKALKALEEQINVLSEQIKNKLISKQLL
jgi:F-type H+-transporting ATPase subunit b|uniref:ATP synthase CF0 subunit II n=1 Tax=Cryptomonas gyropyrenoidosa TaxID=233257 RepID=UPI00279B0529|nr:ATP synthase CF0 subunit II [Cryptomonas gyropyrenoidosa]WFQ82965.1 ATP synthase CF0 subunit II [Cryptomonas gyropyrenoidosa]